MLHCVTQFPHRVEVIESGLWIPVSSGRRLAARLWLPETARDNPVPALLELLPYRKGDLTRVRDETYHAYFGGHGYASIRVDIGGSGDSFGTMQDEYELKEQDDALDVIAWLAAQAWCNGRVGMFGISWGGFNALQVAARRPPALQAIITSCSTDDRYTDDMHYYGGCLLNDNLDWGTTFLALLSLPGDPRIMGEEWRSNWRERLEAIQPPAALWLQHQTRDAYWKHGSINQDYAAIGCPVLAVGGWLDGYSNAIPRMLEHLKTPVRAIIGPHAHQFGFEDRAPGPAYGFLQEAIRWWNHWLKDEANGILDEPKLRAFMGEDIPAAAWYAQCPGRWIAEADWPSPRIRHTRLHLDGESLSNKTRPGPPRVHTSPQSVGLAGGEWAPYGTGGDGPEFPGDQRCDDAYSLTYDSVGLLERLDILGAPIVEIELSVDRPVAFIAVRLNDLKPCGAVTRVSLGVLNLAHRHGHEVPEAIEPGARYIVTVRLNDTAYSFAPGHRLRLSISTTYWPMIWPSPEVVTLTVHQGSGFLALPIRPSTDGEPAMCPLPPPEAAPEPTVETLHDAPRSNKLTYDLATGAVQYAAERGCGSFRISGNGVTFGLNTYEKMSIHPHDPLSAITEVTVLGRSDRAGSDINVKAYSKLTADKSHFLLESRLDVLENERNVYTRAWTNKIPREFL
jgi:uncharacterized protein